MKRLNEECKDSEEQEFLIEGLVLTKNFISETEEKTLIENIDKCPWNNILKRRTQHYGFEYSYTVKTAAKVAPPIPEWCNFLINRLIDKSILTMRPDQLIINEYQSGQG